MKVSTLNDVDHIVDGIELELRNKSERCRYLEEENANLKKDLNAIKDELELQKFHDYENS
jgi:hypothetical protein